jgi:hypothetical protein
MARDSHQQQRGMATNLGRFDRTFKQKGQGTDEPVRGRAHGLQHFQFPRRPASYQVIGWGLGRIWQYGVSGADHPVQTMRNIRSVKGG